MTAGSHLDPLAIDRWLDGEAPPQEVASIEAAVAADAALAARVAARRDFLQQVSRSGKVARARIADSLPAHVDARVRLALAARRRRRIAWPAVAAAATVLIAFGAVLWSSGSEPVEAKVVPMGVLRAIDFAAPSDGPESPGACATSGDFSPLESSVIRMGKYLVSNCDRAPEVASARLVRPEELPVVGWAATRETKDVRGPDIGMTVLTNYVIFDVARGRKREYLAVARKHYDELSRKTPDRASCIVCHNRSREGQDNPHEIRARAWSR